jgi:hypothetical protein
MERGTQVLAQREDVHARRAQVIHRLEYFFVGLAQTQHKTALGEHVGAVPLRMRQHCQRLRIAGARVAHRMREAAYGLQVLREHGQP